MADFCVDSYQNNNYFYFDWEQILHPDRIKLMCKIQKILWAYSTTVICECRQYYTTDVDTSTLAHLSVDIIEEIENVLSGKIFA